MLQYGIAYYIIVTRVIEGTASISYKDLYYEDRVCTVRIIPM